MKTIKIPPLEITYQPINKTWGVNLKSGSIVINEVDEALSVALIGVIRRYDPSFLPANL